MWENINENRRRERFVKLIKTSQSDSVVLRHMKNENNFQ